MTFAPRSPRTMRNALLLGAALAAAGCGARQKQADAEAQEFACKDRIVSYMATHHLGGDEIGVQMDCASAGPRIKRWRIDKAGTRQEDARSMTPGEFDGVWKEIDGSGWAFLKDCSNGDGGPQDPVYVFDIKDDQQQASFQCQSMKMPYPYNTIVDPLDLASQQGRKQLGDPEPEELKKYDHQDKQR